MRLELVLKDMVLWCFFATFIFQMASAMDVMNLMDSVINDTWRKINNDLAYFPCAQWKKKFPLYL